MKPIRRNEIILQGGKLRPERRDEIAVQKAMTIGGGGGGTVDSALSGTSTNPVQNKVITGELGKKTEDFVVTIIAEEGDKETIYIAQHDGAPVSVAEIIAAKVAGKNVTAVCSDTNGNGTLEYYNLTLMDTSAGVVFSKALASPFRANASNDSFVGAIVEGTDDHWEHYDFVFPNAGDTTGMVPVTNGKAEYELTTLTDALEQYTNITKTVDPVSGDVTWSSTVEISTLMSWLAAGQQVYARFDTDGDILRRIYADHDNGSNTDNIAFSGTTKNNKTVVVKGASVTGVGEAWQVFEYPLGDFVVVIEENGGVFSANKTIAEIVSAKAAGKNVVAEMDAGNDVTLRFPLTGYGADLVSFGGTYYDLSSSQAATVAIIGHVVATVDTWDVA